MWIGEGGRERGTRRAHPRPTAAPAVSLSQVRALAVLPDGTLATGSRDKTVKLWKVAPDGRSFDEAATLVREGGGWYFVLIGRSPPPFAHPFLPLSFQIGHTDYVTALTVTQDGRLVSGEREREEREKE